MRTFKETTDDQLDNFSPIAQSITDYVRKHWDCNVKPKGYKEFIEDYEDFDGMEETDFDGLKNDFKGFNDATAATPSFPIKITLANTAYNDINQGRDTLDTLLGAVLGHGMMVGAERGRRKALKSLERIERTLEIYKKHGKGDEIKELIRGIDFDLEIIKLDLIR